MSAVEPVAVIGRYALYDEIAAGGMATVHLGRLLGPVGFARTVAVKRLHQQYARDPEFVSMFLDEARLAARIRHPNVVPTLDVVALSGELFLVMDYVHGVSLSRLMRAIVGQTSRIPVEVVASVIVGALHGLHAAHEARSERGLPLGIVHRDVSPQNIIVGSDGQARVLDFGVAKASWRIQTTRDGQLKGKLSYMAPEQVNGGDVGPWTDVYSTSIVFWEALTNQRLFNRNDSAAILARFTKDQTIAPPSTHNSAVNAALDAVVLKGLAADPKNRFRSAQEMADAIENSVQIASSSSVARWLGGIVREELDHHSTLIAEIENGSRISVRPPGDDAPSVRKMLASLADGSRHDIAVTKTAPVIDTSEGSRSQISMTRSSGLSQVPESRRRKFLLGAGTTAVAAVIALLIVFTRSPKLEPVTAQPASAPETANVLVAAAPPPAPIVAPAEPVVPATATATASAAPPKTAAAPASPAKAVARPAVAPSSPAHAVANCNPPYMVDSRGIRHMKLACLR